MSIPTVMTIDHRECDDLLARLADLSERECWPEADEACGELSRRIAAHFAIEERELFPRFEAATGMTQGPTAVMRMEHGMLREAIARVARAVRAREANEVYGECDALLIMLQQHNLKEETILYPAAQRALADQADALAQQFGRVLSGGG